jgi:hypothetical protein
MEISDWRLDNYWRTISNLPISNLNKYKLDKIDD